VQALTGLGSTRAKNIERQRRFRIRRASIRPNCNSSRRCKEQRLRWSSAMRGLS